jgi:hypothetical protein
MPDPDDNLTPAGSGSRVASENTTPVEYMAAIAAERVVRHLERAGFVVMRKPPLGGHSALGRGFEGP